jgi:hypothetical protein
MLLPYFVSLVSCCIIIVLVLHILNLDLTINIKMMEGIVFGIAIVAVQFCRDGIYYCMARRYSRLLLIEVERIRRVGYSLYDLVLLKL